MKKIAIVFSTRNGQTEKIATYMAHRLQDCGISTQLLNLDRHSMVLSSNVDGVIYGSPVYIGSFSKKLLRWIKSHSEILNKLPTALFTVSLNAADKHHIARVADKALLRKLMNQSGWIPDYAASFSGALNYSRYSWPIRLQMRKISRQTGGDTDMSRDFEYTSWPIVDSFLDSFRRQQSLYSTKNAFPEFRAMDAQLRQFDQNWESSVEVRGTPAHLLQALQELRVGDMKLARLLGRLRTFGESAPEGELFSESAKKFGNTSLPSESSFELLSGLVGKFWQLRFGVRRLRPEEFADFQEQGYAKVLSGFQVEASAREGFSWLHCRMRIHCTSPDAAWKFRVYWFFLGPGIKAYMRSILAGVKHRAESTPSVELGTNLKFPSAG